MKNIDIYNLFRDFLNQYNEYILSHDELWEKNLNDIKMYIDKNNKLPSVYDKNIKK